MKKGKVVLVGTGFVGMSMAYSMLNRGGINELVLVDIDKDKTIGEEMDLSHGLPYAPQKMVIKAGDYEDCKDASLVCIAAGANQKPGETRMDLINKNSAIFKSIIDNVMKNGFKGIFLVATNPLDVMTYITWKYSGFDSKKVIGSGTSLDTARLRFMIGDKLKVNPKNVHAYVIGEHGDSEFIPWSNANIGLQNVKQFLNNEDFLNLENDVRNAAYEIINKKGATYYGIGMCLVRITNAILDDENSILTVSTYDKDNDVYVSLPSVINKNGVSHKIYVNLNKDEEDKLQNSIDLIKEAIDSLKM